jgi:hypothetical protein
MPKARAAGSTLVQDLGLIGLLPYSGPGVSLMASLQPEHSLVCSSSLSKVRYA